MPILEFIQLGIYSLAVALFIVYCSSLPRYSLFLSSMLFMLLIIVENVIPFYRGSSIVEILRGAIGDVSITSGALMLLVIINQFDFSDKCQPVINRAEKTGLVIIGLLLYLSTFGLISFDFYHLGYVLFYTFLVIALLILVLIVINRRLGYAWLIGLIGFYYHWQSSNNLWDYLFDPILWLVMVSDCLASALRQWRQFQSQHSTRWIV